MAIKTIAFDLDDTLFDTSRFLIPIAETDAFLDTIRRPLSLMPGARENLQSLSQKYFLCLVTLGKPEVQKQKVDSLDISSFFQRIEFADIKKLESKKLYFQKIIHDSGIQPFELLSIGNRRSVEIREAKQLGAQTCLFKHGEHSDEPIEYPEDRPDFEVANHFELVRACKL